MRIAPKSSADRSLAYLDRVNRAIDHILGHLDETLSLEVVARAGGFSPFHFHRVFRICVGESVAEFVKRVRLERAVALMTQKHWAGRQVASLTDIALACGFSSSSDFSRCFKQHFGVSPRRFDVKEFRARRRREWERIAADPRQGHQLQGLPPGRNPDGFTVKLRRLPPRWVAYVRVPDSFRPGAVKQAALRHIRWAELRGLADGQWVGYMWDDPEIVAPEHCRYDMAVEVPHPVRGDGVGCLQFPAMQVAEIEMRGGVDLEMRAIDWLHRTWLPASGFVPTEHPAFEAFNGRPFAHGDEYWELRIQIPVKRG